MSEKTKTAIIIGAGPAGLTAAYELLEQTNIKPIIYEMTGDIGGIAKTVNHNGNRIDIGGHRFFSKSEKIMSWWQNIFNIDKNESIPKLKKSDRLLSATLDDKNNKKMLVRKRISRIFFLRNFFDYPVTLNLKSIKNLGLIRVIKIGYSIIWVRLFPIKLESNLEDFFINRFGKELYQTFFKDYTQKVWGVPCQQIKPEWGAQRIKSLSLTHAIFHAIKSIFKKDNSLNQSSVETSLIDKFLYPKFGPGQLWEEVAQQIIDKGGEIQKNQKLIKLKYDQNKISHVSFESQIDKTKTELTVDYLISSVPIKDLINAFDSSPEPILKIAQGLQYRDFITIGILVNKLKIKNKTNTETLNKLIPDNWIYIQENDVKLGRLQIFNNWSPYMVKDPNTVWLGLEYFCQENDEFWNKPDQELHQLAVNELLDLGMIDSTKILDQVVIRMPKAYPAYFGTYGQISEIQNFTNSFHNLFLIGRNGMHRYNNQDHSMLTAMEAVNNIKMGVITKSNIWDVNVEQDYHEEKTIS
ncbi:hypothetical protein BVY03_02120 [bacterium K02(2017)]|nr:hypothetical protein BVY03_02120 [bacterium K02(2017)]